MSTASSPPALPLAVTMPEHLNDIARDRIQKFMAQASPLLSGSPLYAAMAQAEPEIFAQKWLLARMWVVSDAVAMPHAPVTVTVKFPVVFTEMVGVVAPVDHK